MLDFLFLGLGVWRGELFSLAVLFFLGVVVVFFSLLGLLCCVSGLGA